MSIVRRIYVSLPADPWLPPNLNALKWAVVEEIEKLGYTPEIFTNPKGKPGLASSKAWSPRDADEVARRCVGAAILGIPRWKFHEPSGRPVLLPTEFNHYEGALARTLGLPTMVLAQREMLRRVVFDMGFGGYIGQFDESSGVEWLHTDEFKVPFQYWKESLAERRDLFLGYCGKSAEVAASLRDYLKSLGVTILDWEADFIPGRTILDQIENAAGRCTAGLFLFTKDDDLAGNDLPYIAAPRDNVVFEAGFFVAKKGKRNILIVRESGSKMPADLGGDIYAALPDRSDIGPIKRTIASFVGAL